MALEIDSQITPPGQPEPGMSPPSYPPPPPPTPPKKPESTTISTLKGIGQIILEFIITLAIIFVISLVIRMYVLQPFIVDGQSMEPNFHNQEYLLAEKLTPYFQEFERGQVIIFESPSENFNLIKRIIALPNERIVIDKSEVIIYPYGRNKDGIIIYENYIISNGNGKQEKIDITLEKDEYFVLGDNRANSRDSREFGTIKEDSIIGKVWITILPLVDIQMFSAPEYPGELGWIISPHIS